MSRRGGGGKEEVPRPREKQPVAQEKTSPYRHLAYETGRHVTDPWGSSGLERGPVKMRDGGHKRKQNRTANITNRSQGKRFNTTTKE